MEKESGNTIFTFTTSSLEDTDLESDESEIIEYGKLDEFIRFRFTR